MSNITPELIAAIATRLYNEVPGANLVPKTEADLRKTQADLPEFAPQYAAGAPGLPAEPEGMVFPGGAAPIPDPNIYSRQHPGIPEVYGAPIAGSPSVVAGATPPAEGFAWPGAGGLDAKGYSVPSPKASPSSQEGVPGLSGVSPSWPAFPGNAPTTAGSFTVPERATDSGAAPSGLKEFVRQVRNGQVRDERGKCRAGHDPELIQRLFADKSTHAGSAQGSGPRPLDIPAIRKDFPVLQQKVHGKDLAWMDNGATTQKPQSVIDAISRFYENDNSNIHRGAHTLAARATDAFEQARQKVQTFIGAGSSKEIVWVRGTTEGINFVAQTYGRKFLQPGDEIVLSTLEHHANIVPWQMIAKETGAVIRVIPINDRGEVMLEAYQALLGPRTKLVALTQASNSLGTVLPVAEMTRAAKRYNARVLIDGAQSVSHMPVNMQEIGCDFFVFSGHKIFAPTGIGAVYVSEQLHEIMPPWHGGGNMIKNVTFEETTYNEAPAKFEAGTPNIADAVGLGAALDYVNRLGLVNTGKYEHELLEYATEELSRIDGVRLLGSAREKVSVISFVVKDRKVEEVGRLLDQEGIAVRAGHHCAQPSLRRFGVEATVRPSFAFYNTFEEIDRLADTVKRIAHSPRSS